MQFFEATFPSMKNFVEMNRIDDLIANRTSSTMTKQLIHLLRNELTLTDGGDLHLLDTFKVWSEQIFGWYYFVERMVYQPATKRTEGKYVRKMIKAPHHEAIPDRGSRFHAKSMYAACISGYFLNVDTTTTHPDHSCPNNEAG